MTTRLQQMTTASLISMAGLRIKEWHGPPQTQPHSYAVHQELLRRCQLLDELLQVQPSSPQKPGPQHPGKPASSTKCPPESPQSPDLVSDDLERAGGRQRASESL